MGRVCYHTCETVCNRARVDDAVGINSVERFLGDEALKRGWSFAAPTVESGQRVLVVGAGPSGMSAAYHCDGWATGSPSGRPGRWPAA
jgi:NADPH-dependent glutamate synthase beta subunit-like oxidoreductase